MMITVTPLEPPHPIDLPPLIPVRQTLAADQELDLRAATEREFAKLPLLRQLAPGARVAVTAGSRGIARIAEVVAAVVAALRDRGFDPFVVPAMGSHGGATAAGQLAVLADLGVTEEFVRAPIRATMETVLLGQIDDGTPVRMDRYAAEADGILLINRIKPHTDFQGPIESGLAKVLAVGLGKRDGAVAIHSAGPNGLRSRIPLIARVASAARPVLGGLAILENPQEDVAALVGLPPEEIGAAGETALLERARVLRPTLPFEQIDLLIVDEMGKDVSGTGMDTGVIGRMHIPGVPEPGHPAVNCIVVLSLTAGSHGNAAGIGLADVVSARLASVVDWKATWTNSLTSGILGPGRARLPMVAADDHRAVMLGRMMCGVPLDQPVRVVRITSTKHLAHLWVSPAILAQAKAPLTELGPAAAMSFDAV
ncbi:MAG: lactate racemase domain-containing protein [Roseiflexaceae bacterium]